MSLKSTLISVALLALIAAPLAAKKAPENRAEFAPDAEIVTVRQGNLTINTATGLPTTMAHVNFPLDHDAPEDMARQFLAAQHATFGLRADLSDLQLHAVRESIGGTTVRLRQFHEGIPVHSGEIAVSYDRDEVVRYVSSSIVPVGPIDLAPSLEPLQSADAARKEAYAILGVEKVTWEDLALVIFVRGEETYLAHRVRVIASVGPTGEWQVMRDARSGEILQVIDRAFYGGGTDGDGSVFDPDPLSSSGAEYNDPGYTDGGDATTPQLDAETFNRPMRDIQFAGGMYTLIGPYAEIIDSEGPNFGLFSQPTSSWVNDRSASAFEASHTYYHIDTYMRYINETLGIAISPYQYSGGARFDPHGLNGADNSFYTSGGGFVAFGEGGVDDAEDADVVIHELGHGLHDWFTQGGLSQVNGLSEGFGDYVAQSYSRWLNQWTPADPEYHWVFHWDGHNPFWGGRITNYGATYPGGLIGQIHTDGQIWATCNMLIWDAIGREAIDAAMFEGLRMTGSSTNQEDAAQATLQAAADLAYSASELSTMESIYQGCGYSVTAPPSASLFEDGFESGDLSAWSATVP